MKKISLLPMLAIVLLGSAAVTAGPVVNGVLISDARIEQIIKQLTTQPGQASKTQVEPQLKKEIIDRLIVSELLRREAVRKGLDKSADYEAQLQNVQSMILAQRLIEDFQRQHPITPAQLQEEYDKIKTKLTEKKSYHAQHIMVKTEAEAKNILAELEKGKPFAQLAEKESTDPGSNKRGGDLGWFELTTMDPKFSAAITQLKKGQITAAPVETQYGWHVIRLEDVKVEPPPMLDTLTPQLEQQLKNQQVQKLIDELRANAKITQ